MRFQTPLEPAVLLRRYKRFLADIRLADGREVTAHCPNPGAMTGLADPGRRIWVEPTDNPARKLKYGWRLVELAPEGLACVDTGLANRVLRAALADRAVAPLAGYDRVRPEMRYAQKSRVDFLLSGPGLPDAYLEVKSVTLSRRPGLAEFPDTVTVRGARHLTDLAAMARGGARALTLYLVQRTDCRRLRLAGDIDPAYAGAFAAARAAGVEALAYGARITPQAITLGAPLPLG